MTVSEYELAGVTTSGDRAVCVCHGTGVIRVVSVGKVVPSRCPRCADSLGQANVSRVLDKVIEANRVEYADR